MNFKEDAQMAETIYSIPINESFDRKCGCPLCRLHSDLERSSLEYIMGAAMMEPYVRLETNRLGFCRKHSGQMYAMKNRLSLSLTLQTRLEYVKALFESPSEGGKSLFGKKNTLSDPITAAASECFVCRRVGSFDSAIISNTIHLWKTDNAFRDKLKEQPFLCLEHSAALLEEAGRVLSKERYTQFHSDIADVCLEHIRKLARALNGFVASFDHRNAGVPLTEEQRNSAEDTIAFLCGKDGE